MPWESVDPPPCGRPDRVALLGPFDPHPVRVSNPEGRSPFLLVSDHAGRRRPDRLGDLGVARADWSRHIAFDIGMKGVGGVLARLLDATLVEQRYSRLVIDCNRPPGHESSIPTLSEATTVPGNRDVDLGGRLEREAEILRPYHEAIAGVIAGRRAAGRQVILVALHSFTPVFLREVRPWHAGILHAEPDAFARTVLALLQAEPGLVVGDNEPYRLSATSDYTVPLHGWSGGIQSVEVEIRQDLIAKVPGQAEWAARMARLLAAAVGKGALR